MHINANAIHTHTHAHTHTHTQDGIPDVIEGDDYTDSDHDGVPDYLDLDSDGDGKHYSNEKKNIQSPTRLSILKTNCLYTCKHVCADKRARTCACVRTVS